MTFENAQFLDEEPASGHANPVVVDLPLELAVTLVEIGRLSEKVLGSMTRLTRKVERALAAAVAADKNVDDRRRALDVCRAQLSDAAARAANSSPTGHPDDRGYRTGKVALYATAAGVFAIEFAVDSGALLLLSLPLFATRVLAAGVSLMSLGLAHFTGRTFKRANDMVFAPSGLGAFEWGAGTKVVPAVGLTIALAMAALRTWYTGSLLSGFLFAMLGVGAFTLLTMVAYGASNGAVDQLHAARRRSRRAVKKMRRAEHRTNKRMATYRTTVARLVGGAGCQLSGVHARLLQGVQTFRRNNPEAIVPRLPLPAWVDVLERVAGGEIPKGLDLSIDQVSALDHVHRLNAMSDSSPAPGTGNSRALELDTVEEA
jgi:hypothetical protein